MKKHQECNNKECPFYKNGECTQMTIHYIYCAKEKYLNAIVKTKPKDKTP